MVAAVRPRKRVGEPEIVEMPAVRMAAVHAVGPPEEQGQRVLPALFGGVYTLKFQRKHEGVLPDFRVGPLRARWTKAGYEVPPAEFEGIWALPVPDGVTEVPQKVADVRVDVETWEYGEVAQILHRGAYDAEAPTIERLLTFVEERGYEVVGPHEEEYLTGPEAKVPRTIIRYRVRRKAV